MGNKALDEKSYYRSLKRDLLAIILVVSLTPLLVIALIAGYQFHTAYRHEVVAHLKELVDRHAQHIDSFLDEKLADIRILAALYPVEKLRDQSFLNRLLDLLRNKYGQVFIDLGLVDAHGFQVAYAGPFQLKQANYSNARWFKQALLNPYTISDVFLGLRGFPHFIVAVHINEGGNHWVFRSTIDFVAFNRLVEGLHVGKTGEAFIINRAGEFQTTPPRKPVFSPLELIESVVGSDADFNPSHSSTEGPNGASASRWEAAGSQKGFDTRWQEKSIPQTGRSILIFYRPLKAGQWILFYTQDKEDAYFDLYRARRLSVLILLIGTLAIACTAWGLSRRVVTWIFQADREKELMSEQVIEAGKLASIGELAAGIAHEINNPVAIMMEEAGWVQDLLDDMKEGKELDTGEVHRSLRQIRLQGTRCKEITHKLLSFARRTDPAVQEIEINQLVTEVVGLVEQRAKYAGVQIRTNLTDALPSVAMSPAEMQQVLLNLANNALDAMEKTGGVLEITTRLEDDRVLVDVADTGQGIAPANLTRIFDPFFTTKPVGRGTGLGLSICYGIIKKMGGDISVNSAVGVGTTFHVHLPASDDKKRKMEAATREKT